MIESDVDYLRRRAAEEEHRAATATDARIAVIHQRMAALYADRVSAMIDHPGFDPIVQTRLSP